MNASFAASDVAGRRNFLVSALRLDALASGTMGVILAAAGPWLDGVLSAPTALLVPLGLFLVLYASGLWLLARSDGRPVAAVKAVVGGNILWVIASIAVVLLDVLTLSGIGTTLAVLQALAVAGFAELQVVGLRRARR